MQTIAIANQKGGIGKTTTAHNLAAGLVRARCESRVLLIDLDPQCNLTNACGAFDLNGYSVYELLTNACSAREATTIRNSYDVMPASTNLAGADSYLTSTGREYRLREALTELASDYDYAILDTPPALGILLTNALTAANGVIIPANAEAFSLRAIQQLKRTLDVVQRYTNPSLDVYGILFTRYSTHTTLARELTSEIDKTAALLNMRVFDTHIRENVALREAQALGLDIFAYAPASHGAADYMALTQSLLNRIGV